MNKNKKMYPNFFDVTQELISNQRLRNQIIVTQKSMEPNIFYIFRNDIN